MIHRTDHDVQLILKSTIVTAYECASLSLSAEQLGVVAEVEFVHGIYLFNSSTIIFTQLSQPIGAIRDKTIFWAMPI